MTRHDDGVRLRHMLDHAAEATSLARGKTRRDLGEDRMLELSLVRLLEVVGEAAARVSDETREQFSGIPWKSIVGLRNRLIHGYDAVDLDVLWDIVQRDLPPLIRQLRQGLDGR